LDPFLETGQKWPMESSVSDLARVEVSVAACTDIGRKRQNNEDRLLVLDLNSETTYDQPVEATVTLGSRGLLLAVADGMGGHRSGEVASQLCIKTLPRVLLSALQSTNSGPTQASTALVQAVETASQVISEEAAQNPAHEGMGTTLTAALLRDMHLDVAQVGDSRAYVVRRETLTQLTTDQTVANYMLAMRQELPTDSHVGEMLVQAVGGHSGVDVVLTSDELENGDVLLLCSDGLYKTVSSSEILEICQGLVSLKTIAERLVARANENGGPDNVTVILAEVRARGALPSS
jgi:serine/threonine protein phosphatase PrpC